MANPYKPEDKVLTKHKGVEVEATVRLVWNDEVQVRTPDGVLRWRVVKTVRPAFADTPATEPGVQAPSEAPATVPTEQPHEPPPLPNADAQPEPAPVAETQPAPQQMQEDTQAKATAQPKTNVVPCGATEEQRKAKDNRKARRRR